MNVTIRKRCTLLFISCLTIISVAVACQPKVVSVNPSTESSAGEAATDNSSVNASDKAAQTEAMIEYLTNLPIPTPDFSSEQDDNPVARMNSPESLEGSGPFPDNYYTSEILHTGARGCMSCHADLYSLVKNLSPTLHVASPPTYGKPDDINTCLVCHHVAGNLTGPKMADIIHAAHDNNELFTDTYNGNCWSCHATDVDGELVLWDTVKFDASMAGYPDQTNDDVINWQKMRGFENGNIIGFSLVDDLELEVVEAE